ncbi:biotin-dependent carboxyltransferase family protein [Leekyejoonella antrihumi]|uniref:Biotin-dependent carboxyltransferase family protein n=1 Tax=Leekyejoonella antrihumi TaxID=1660198 RepID=A0A563DS94_9MICO|nr:biotin-dependent carboxyltransferase family protein [Leekyejoonella antrihumi]
MRAFEVVETGALATVQDLGRPGLASLGVGVSGAADTRSLRLANRLLGNDEGAAALEVTFGGLAIRAGADLLVAVTGAPCPLLVDGSPRPLNAPLTLGAGQELRLLAPPVGLRSYLAVRGGIDVDPVLGSRSCDVMAGLGPKPLEVGARLPVGIPPHCFPEVDVAPTPAPCGDELMLRIVPGPRSDWFTAEALETLTSSSFEVTSESNRVGMRLDGPELERCRTDELPSEGMVPGALQVPPAGRPTLFLADHPVTGGYPVVGVVVTDDIPIAAQARPGQRLRFRVPPNSPYQFGDRDDDS